MAERQTRTISYEDRKRFEEMYRAGASINEIGAEMGICETTVYREIRRGSTGEMDRNGRLGYSAEIAQKDVLAGRMRMGRRARHE